MIYEKRLSIPKNTTRGGAAEATIETHPGILRQVEIVFPAGCVGLVHAMIELWERQLFPANPDSDFSGDDIHLVFPEDLELKDPPYAFTVKGWSDDDTYTHTVTVRLQIIPFDKDPAKVLSMLFTGPNVLKDARR